MQLYVLVYIFVALATTAVSTEKTDSPLVEDNDGIQKIDNDLVVQLLQRVNHLEARDKLQQSEIDKLRLQVQSQQKRTTWLEGMVRFLKRQSRKPVLVPNESTDDLIKTQVDENRPMGHNFNSNRRDTSIHSRRQKRAEVDSSVGFLATLSYDQAHMGVNQNIVFDRVVTNVGNAYNNHNGGFVAPVAGLYVFSATLLSLNSDSHFEFIKNGSPVSNMYIRGQESIYSTSSQTWCLELNQGDDVAIRNKDTDESLGGSSYTSFTGFLLQQNYQDSGTIVGK